MELVRMFVVYAVGFLCGIVTGALMSANKEET